MPDSEEDDLLDPIYRIDEGLSLEALDFWFKAAFGAMFSIGGSVMLFSWLVSPWMETEAAKSWVTVPCEVVSSEVKSRVDEDRMSYWPAIEYVYVFEEQEYRGDRYSLSLAYDRENLKSWFTTLYPPGKRLECFVDPENPAESTILREHFFRIYHLLVPLLFIWVGVWLIQRERKKRASPGQRGE